jgi:hypothetical protein
MEIVIGGSVPCYGSVQGILFVATGAEVVKHKKLERISVGATVMALFP